MIWVAFSTAAWFPSSYRHIPLPANMQEVVKTTGKNLDIGLTKIEQNNVYNHTVGRVYVYSLCNEKYIEKQV